MNNRLKMVDVKVLWADSSGIGAAVGIPTNMLYPSQWPTYSQCNVNSLGTEQNVCSDE